ncbi:MAG TPA: transglutaminaseTgpA domain-containing protein [Bryobacteraceae bacterium]|nr:transglutaminaseTgpA domain-containing protein [Bryobacteraceae bacterium]
MEATATARPSPVERFFEFALLGLLTSGFLAVAGSGYLDLPTMAATAAALAVRALLAAGAIRFELPPAIVTAATLAYIAFYPVDYFFISQNFIPAAVHLVFFVAVVKIVTGRTNRDYLFLKLIAFLELLAACVLSTHLNFFVFLLLFLVLGVATFASAELRQSREQRRSAGRVSGLGLSLRLTAVVLSVSFGILVITAGLFFFLPRTARAAFQHLVSHRYHLAGFSDHVMLGEIGEIKKENTPVMHVEMDHPDDRGLPLKWRGATLSEFNGRAWFNRPAAGDLLQPGAGGLLQLDDSPRREEGYRHISYEVHLNEEGSDALFFAGTPQFLRIQSPVIRRPSDNLTVQYGEARNLWYQVYSRLEPPFRESHEADELIDPLPAGARRLYLQLPRLDPRIPELARNIVGAETSPGIEARRVEVYLRTHFGYTLELPPAEPADPLGFFLFHRKKGHCEYFASAMAVMLRTLGIPSRMVTGFQSGVYNPISGTQLIRTSDAHSWVEAWIPNHGWTTFDPTPPDPNPAQLSWWTRLGFYADAAEVFWNDWVLNYNLDRQLQLARGVGKTGRNVGLRWYDFSSLSGGRLRSALLGFGKRYGLVLLGIVVLALTGRVFGRHSWRWWQTRQRVLKVQRGEAQASDATLLYQRMLTVLIHRGIEKPAWLTPCEFARVLQEPELARRVENLTEAYNQLRFGGRPEAAGRMVQLLQELETAP